MQLDFRGEGFRCAQSARLGISKIIRSSKQRGGLGRSPANLFDFYKAHCKIYTELGERGYGKGALAAELGDGRLPRCVFQGGERLTSGWVVGPAANTLRRSLLSSPLPQRGEALPHSPHTSTALYTGVAPH